LAGDRGERFADVIRPARHKAWRVNTTADKTTSATKYLPEVSLKGKDFIPLSFGTGTQLDFSICHVLQNKKAHMKIIHKRSGLQVHVGVMKIKKPKLFRTGLL
jgi:hypothetical protein